MKVPGKSKFPFRVFEEESDWREKQVFFEEFLVLARKLARLVLIIYWNRGTTYLAEKRKKRRFRGFFTIFREVLTLFIPQNSPKRLVLMFARKP